jgi:hypothetical protein
MKSDLPLNLIKAEIKASEIIETYGIVSPDHIVLKDIAFDLGVTVVERPLHGAAGSLVQRGTSATIRVPPEERYPERTRFSIAHELGHFLLKHGYSLRFLCPEEAMFDWQQDSGQESEANFFAGELLLPKKLFKDRCDVREVNFAPVRKLAQDFTTSITATAIRFVRFCPEMCALIFSKDSQVKWFYRSESWWPFIRKGALDINTFAANFFRNLEVPDEPLEVDGDAWVESRGVESIVEHSICSPRLGFVLSLLWIKS